MKRHRLAILNSHPIQYFVPLYQRLAQETDIDLTVFYCSQQGVAAYVDQGFGEVVQWDIPLLDGYHSVFLNNISSSKNVGGFWSLVNPSIIEKLHRQSFDALLIHGHNHFTNLLAFATARILGIPVLIRGETHLLLKKSRLKSMIRRPLMSAFYSQCTACIAIGTRNVDFYRYHRVPDAKIFLAPYVIDNTRFIQQVDAYRLRKNQIKTELGIPLDMPVLLFASKFTWRKHPIHLLKAKSFLQDNGIECAVLMVGSGEEEQRLQSYCREHDLRNVSFVGFRNQSDMPMFYSLADIFVLPSENEPWGLVINEAMSAGLPIVATSEIGAVIDLVKPGENGELYSVGDIDALTEILSRLLLAKGLREQMGNRSRLRISDWNDELWVKGVKKALRAVSQVLRK